MRRALEHRFAFAQASEAYLSFYETHGEGETFQPLVERGADALRALARIHSASNEPLAAARFYDLYAREHPRREDAPALHWRAIEHWERAAEEERALEGYKTHVKRYRSNRNADHVLSAINALADHSRERGEVEDARAWAKQALEVYAERSGAPNALDTEEAARAEFMLLKLQAIPWLKMRFSGSEEEQGEQLEAKTSGLEALERGCQKVRAHGVLEWSLAAHYFQGMLYQNMVTTLDEAPVPFPEGSEQWDVYRSMLTDVMIPFEDRSLVVFTAVLEEARQEGHESRWVTAATRELHRYRPREHRLYRARVEQLVEVPIPSATSSSAEALEALSRNERDVDAMVALAQVHYEASRYALVEIILSRAIVLEPERGDARYLRGMAAARRGEDDEARVQLERAVASAQVRPEWFVNLGVVRHRMKDFGAAITSLKKALDADAEPGVTWLALGNAYVGSGQTDLALGAYEKARGEEATRLDATYNLALLLIQHGVVGMDRIESLTRGMSLLDEYEDSPNTKFGQLHGGSLTPLWKEARRELEHEEARRELQEEMNR